MTGSNLNFDERIKFHSQWAGLCDQLESLTSEETDRRSVLRDSMSEEPLDAHILDLLDTREALGRISVFFSYRDATGPYEQWCGEWFTTFEAAEIYRAKWALELYDNPARLRR